MRRMLWAFFLAGLPILWPAAGLHAGETRPKGEKPGEKAGISGEDRQVIRNMELLRLMEMLKDMEILEGKTKTAPEEKK